MLFIAALTPNVDHYVFVKVVNDVAGIVLEEESRDAGYDSVTCDVCLPFLC